MILLKSRVEPGFDWRGTEAGGIEREKPIPSSGMEKAVDDDDGRSKRDNYNDNYELSKN